MKDYLATTAISEIWDMNENLLLLAPWCLIDRNKGLLKKKEYRLVESPWTPFLPKVMESVSYCHALHEDIVPQITRALNNLHGVSYPEKYWRTLIGYWLLHFIAILYERYCRIQNAVKQYPDLYTHCFHEGVDISSNDTFDFMNQIYGDEYNFKLFSHIIHDLGINAQKIDMLPGKGHRVTVTRETRWSSIISKIRRSLGRVTNHCISRLSSGPVALVDMHYLRKSELFMLCHKSGYRDFQLADFFHERGSFDYSHAKRQKIILKPETNDPFKSLIFKLLPIAIPRSLIEGFGFYKCNSQLLGNVKAIGSFTGWYVDEQFKFYAAEQTLNGVRMVEFLHGFGGLYGIGSGAYYKTFVEDKDTLYTWGWECMPEYGKKLLKLPSPLLSRIRDRHSNRINKVLYVSTSTYRYAIRFQAAQKTFVEGAVIYVEEIKRFFQGLDSNFGKYILYRNYPNEFGWDLEKIVKDLCPQAQTLKTSLFRRRLTDWLRKIKICVIDHFGTTLMEALAINVPCISFWNHEFNVIHPEADKYFDLLRREGIVHKDPESAAAKLKEVFDDPQAWWKSKEIQDVRHIFLEQFGYSRKNWMDYWVKEIRRLGST